MTPRYAVLCLTALCGLSACVSAPRNFIAPGQEGAPGVQRVLLCPPNLVLALRPEIESGAEPLERELSSYLEAHGQEVERIGLFQGRRLWKRAVAAAAAAGSVESGAAIFVRLLAEERDFQALVMPSLLVHQARANMGSASWDGVRRRMMVVNRPSRGVGRDRDWNAEAIASGGVTGPVYVTSVHVMVFSREGERVFEGRGGIHFVHEIDVTGMARTLRWTPRLRRDLFADPAILREGVQIALSPYLAPLPEP